MTNAWLTCSSLRSRHLEIVGERENGRARGGQATRAVSFTIDKSIRKSQKQPNIQRVFNATASANLSDYNYCTYYYVISVFLYTVLYFIKKWFIVTNFTLPRLFRNPAISNFFPFPLGLRNSGVQLYLHSPTNKNRLVIQIQKAIWRKLESLFSRNKMLYTSKTEVTENSLELEGKSFRPDTKNHSKSICVPWPTSQCETSG